MGLSAILSKQGTGKEECDCRDGMRPDLQRRAFLGNATKAGVALMAVAAGTGAAAAQTKSSAPAGSIAYDVPDQPAKELGRPLLEDGGYGTRSQFETEARVKEDNPTDTTSWTFTPLASMLGNITPSGLHFERHHGGIPTIDRDKHELIIHGMVEAEKKFTMADLMALPSVTRKHFIECSGNTLTEWKGVSAKNVQRTHGLVSTSEWTGVLFSTLARAVNLDPNAEWVLAEGADAAVMTRSIPIDKLMTDGILAYGQNGEALRPEQGYPLRLLLPGYEGNTHIKWLRRLQVSDKPFMTREETSKYSDLYADGRAKLFTLQMDPKSVITFPSGEMKLPKPGFYEIRGFAWSGRGKVQAVDISTDGGKTWAPARIDSTPEPMSTVRFSFPWNWDGKPAVLQSRCWDETGARQLTRSDLIAMRGRNSVYHYNAIQSWAVDQAGDVTNVQI